ncbi:DAK2 domain-containing protein [uncultured Ruegeria sp.]|uniref:DAK2 domain-containing protein n=1 Tax=uncultured Ruegeria sp. TaxID=259304 RepID=UPI00261B0308|nr:DAK2 domain-containing protein [uncultured Ruegeria sp.]
MSADRFFESLLARYAVEADHLNALDAAIGDGDHGTTMLRGLTKAAAAKDGKRAKAFMRASGGASGTLFGLILLEIEAHLGAGAPLNLTRACDRICDLGDVAPGDKSMVDALSPALAAQDNGLAAMITAATTGCDATVGMTARRGRAQYVENAGRGHMDPGAASVVIFLETLAKVSE